MGYTHYNDAPISSNIDELYRGLLSLIKSDDGDNLLEYRFKYIDDDDAIYKYFHETYADNEGVPRVSKDFTKTARKRYDPAILLSYLAAAIIYGVDSSGDWCDGSTERLAKHIQDGDKQNAQNSLLYYVEQEDIDIGRLDLNRDEPNERAYNMVSMVIDFLDIVGEKKEDI